VQPYLEHNLDQVILFLNRLYLCYCCWFMAFSCKISGYFKLSWFSCSKLLLRPTEWSKATDLLYPIYNYAFLFTCFTESSGILWFYYKTKNQCFIIVIPWVIGLCLSVSNIFMVLLTTNEIDNNMPYKLNFFGLVILITSSIPKNLKF